MPLNAPPAFNTSLLDAFKSRADAAGQAHRSAQFKNGGGGSGGLGGGGKRRKRLFETLIDNQIERIGADTVVPGDVVLKKLRDTIRLFRMTKQQLLMTEMYTQTQLRAIYGEDFFANEMKIMSDNELVDLYKYVTICCPRRFGKTFITSIWAACMLCCVPDTKLVLYSPGKRQSSYIMDLVRSHLEFLKQHIDWEVVPGKDNKEQLSIRVDGNVRSIQGLPAAKNTTRGSGGTCIICEEAAAMEQSFFVEVVLPVTGPSIASCICISTIQSSNEEGEQNWFTTLLDMCYDDGRPMFNKFVFLGACEECIAAGIARECKHNMNELPFWQESASQMDLRLIMSKLGRSDAAEQELMGITTTSLKAVLPITELSRIFNASHNPPFHVAELVTKVDLVFISIDVSLGGAKSNTALVSGFPYKGQFVIIGGEEIPNKVDDEFRPILIKHILTIRGRQEFKYSKIVIIIENNTVGVARHVYDDICLLPDYNTFIEVMRGVQQSDTTSGELFKGRKSFGVSTQGRHGEGNVKEEMVLALKGVVKSECIKFYPDAHFTTLGPQSSSQIFKRSLFNQLKNLSKKFQLQTSSFHTPKYTYDAKHAGPDDCFMALALNIYWQQVYLHRGGN